MWLIKPVVFFLCLAPTCQQFPRLCTSPEALQTKECCPPWEGDGSACGARSGRGSCEDVVVSEQPDGPQYPFSGLDDREKWPLVFYNRTCRCVENFMGFNCADCKFGYFGENCHERRESLRRNIFHLTRAERNRLVSYLNLAKQTVSRDYVVATGTYRDMANGSIPMFADVSVYDVFVWMHYYVSRNALLGGPGNVWTDVDFAHWAPAFPPWHRVYLLHWEHEIRKLTGDRSFTIPYWDWRDAQGCDVCTDELMGGRSPEDPSLISPGSVFSSWKGASGEKLKLERYDLFYQLQLRLWQQHFGSTEDFLKYRYLDTQILNQSSLDVLCSKAEEYSNRGVLCDASDEGPVRRNPGNHNRNLVERLPTSADVEFTLSLPSYDTGAMDRSANMSFRNTLEGFGDPQTGLGNSARLGMHASLHVYMNGSMSSVQGSANDPIFILHHAFVDSLYEQWLRRHSPSPSQYPELNAPIGHNGDYHMAPFLPLHRNKEYFISSKELGYEYSHLLNANQRLAESMRPYLDDLQGVWPWLLLAGLCGVIVTLTIVGAVLLAKRPSKMLWPSVKSWRSALTLPERQPLIWSNKMEESSYNSYQTTM